MGKQLRELVEFNLFYKTLVPVLRDFGIVMDEEQVKKFIKCVLSLIALFCVKNPDKYFKVGKLIVTRSAILKNNVFVVSLNRPVEDKEYLNKKMLDEFTNTLLSNELCELIKGYFKTVVEEEKSS